MNTYSGRSGPRGKIDTLELPAGRWLVLGTSFQHRVHMRKEILVSSSITRQTITGQLLDFSLIPRRQTIAGVGVVTVAPSMHVWLGDDVKRGVLIWDVPRYVNAWSDPRYEDSPRRGEVVISVRHEDHEDAQPISTVRDMAAKLDKEGMWYLEIISLIGYKGRRRTVHLYLEAKELTGMRAILESEREAAGVQPDR